MSIQYDMHFFAEVFPGMLEVIISNGLVNGAKFVAKKSGALWGPISQGKRANTLKITPIPNKFGLYGTDVSVHMPEKSGFICHKSRFAHHILCESPFILQKDKGSSCRTS